MHARDRRKHLVGVELGARHLRLQLVRQHVDKQLGVAVGVEVASVDIEKFAGEFARVREVAVVHEDDAVRRVDVEGLRLFFTGCRTPRRVPHVPQAEGAQQAAHVARAVGLAHLPLGLHHVQHAPFGGGDAGRVLPAMLQQGEGVVDLLSDRTR